jgi:hypothetical protein
MQNIIKSLQTAIENKCKPVWTWLRTYIFTFNRPRYWHLPWHFHLQDGSWDIRLTFLLIPVIVYLFCISANGWIIFLTLLSGCQLGLTKPR